MGKIKVFLVEDDKMLSTVFTMFLNDLGYDLIGNFQDPNDAISKIEEGEKPDIILMDIMFPSKMNGIEAAKIINEKYKLPVVFISSVAEEETVNSAILAKPYGYLVKPIDKTNLKITIDIALSKHKDYSSLKVQNTIINNLDTGIFTVDKRGNFLCFNTHAESLFGYSKSQINNSHISALLSDSDINFEEDVIPYLNTGNEHSVEITKANKKININFIVEKDSKNQFNTIIAIAKPAKESSDSSKLEANLNSIYDSSLEAIILVNNDFVITNYNKLAAKYFSAFFHSDIKEGDKVLDALSFLNKFEFSNLFENTIEGVSHYLERVVNINNIEKHFKITVFPVIEGDDTVKNFYVTFYDISNVKETERLYEETKAELKPLFESSIQRFYLCDLNYKLVSFNKSAQLIIYNEFNRHLKKGDNILDFVPNEIGKDLFINRFEDAKKGEHVVFKEKIIIKETEYWNESHLDPILNERGEISRILLWTLDITESEQNLQVLEETKERNELVAKGGNDGIWDWDIRNNKIYLSPRWKAVLGYGDGEITEEYGVHDKITHPDDLAKSKEALSKYLNKETENYYVEIRLLNKDGNYIWVAESGAVLRDSNDMPIRLAGSITNITERKEKETELNAINNTLIEERNMFLKGDVVVIRADARDISKISYISENVKDVLGFTKEEFMSQKISFSEIISSEDYEQHLIERTEAVNSGKSHIEFSNYSIITKSGKKIWVKDFTTIIRNKVTDKIELFGYFIDISDKIAAEQELTKNKLKFEKLFTEANDAILILEKDKINEFNNKALEIFGYSEQEFQNINISSLSPETQPDGENTQNKKVSYFEKACNDNIETFYWQFIKEDGSLFDAEVSLTSIIISETKYLHAIIRDISIRKTFERSLKESQQKIRSIYNAVPDLIFVIDKEGTYLDYKPDSENKLSTNPQDIIGKNLNDFFDEEKAKTILSKIYKTIKTGEVEFVNYDMDSAIGIRNFEARISAINENTVLSIVRDVTKKPFNL